ncbi:hypothetical protein [Thalassotalea piscium]|uniref:Uncharacterized protein n=1 Tax=Thalassotalea piscium TaxID=1230533 RepID=A0A7X0NJN3_9GAMM|nr:hypothetical protein [Thalassotalea piscium]MBB6544702.1 hypothetical protein [Thalassotalea piscium]
MSDLLKGNFTTQKEVKKPEENCGKDNAQQAFKKAALNSIGGSMVYVERTDLTWDGEE